VCEIKPGKDYKHLSEGDIPVYGSGGIMTYVNKYVYDKPTVLLPRKGSISNVFYVDTPFWNVDTIYYTIIDTNVILPRYFYFIILNEHIEKYNTSNAARPALTRAVLDKIEIPLPPITIQEKIVEILDKFTSLEAELEAELEARRKQYEYYREKLFTFSPDDENVRWATLGEIGTFVKGSGIQKSDFVENGYPCIHYGQLHTYYGTFTKHNKSFISKALFDKCKKAQNGDLIIATTSEDVEACCKATAWLGDSEVAVSGDAHIYHHNQNPKYITYFFQTELFSKQKRKHASGVKVVRVSSDNLSKISIPLPPLSEQRRIVAILDRFEALTNDLQAGLPAEIAARRQQYEYYREKLLTFKRKTV